MDPAATHLVSKRVLIVGWADGGTAAGVGVACRALVDDLLAMGCEVMFVDLADCPRAVAAEAHADSDAVVTLTLNPYFNQDAWALVDQTLARARESIDNDHLNVHAPTASSAATLETVAAAFVAAAVEADGFEPEVVHANDWLAAAAAAPVARAHEAPLVAQVHATEFERAPGRVHTDLAEREAAALQQADLLVAVSARSARLLTTRYGIDPERVAVVEPACLVPTNPETASSLRRFPEFTVLFLARVSWQKGPFFFLEAAIRLLAVDRNWRFVVAGDGECLPEMIERAAAAGVSDRVHFCGWLHERDRDLLLAEVDALYVPSVEDPYGLAVAEAIAAGVVPVVSRQAGIAERLPPSMAVDYWDVEAACERLWRYRDDAEMATAALTAAVAAMDALTPDRRRQLIARYFQRATALRGE